MRGIHQTKQLLVFSTLAVSAILVVYIFLFLYIAAEGRETSILQNDVDFVTQKESKLRSIQSTLSETEDDRTRLDTYFVSPDGIVPFIESIEGFAGVSGATIDISSVDTDLLLIETSEKSRKAEKEENLFAELVRLNFKAHGTWSQVAHTLALLETLPYRVTITRATFEGGSALKEDATNTWTGFFTITAIKKK